MLPYVTKISYFTKKTRILLNNLLYCITLENTSMESKELTTVEIPVAISNEVYSSKLTKRQRNFVLLLVHSEGKKSASQCAYEAGYAKNSCRITASELQNPKLFPKVVDAINAEVSANAERYRCTTERSLAVLQRIRDQAVENKNFGNAVAAERARGELVNLYDKKLTVLHGSIEQMSRAEVEQKIKDMMKQYDITEEAEEVKPVKQIENRA